MTRAGLWPAVAVAALAIGSASVPGAAQTLETLYEFDASSSPRAPVVTGPDGALYLPTENGGSESGAILRLSRDPVSGEWLKTAVHVFGASGDGVTPLGGLVADASGNLYGTTRGGGAHDYGTVYELAWNGSSWTYSVLFSFDQSTYPDPNTYNGCFPETALTVVGTDLLGTTTACGYRSNGSDLSDNGTVYRTSTDGGILVKRWFHSTLYDGSARPGGPVVASDANHIYGYTTQGGTSGLGSVFGGGPSPVGWHHYPLTAATGAPRGRLLLGPDGALYGTTADAGASGLGTVFRLTTDMSTWTVIDSFGGADGAAPHAGLVLGADGSLYGTTSTGGAAGKGTVFRLSGSGTSWTRDVIHEFGGPDGATPEAALVFSSDGNTLYGTTSAGGAFDRGTVFELTRDGSSWTQSVITSFDGVACPQTGLLLHSNGRLYGGTSATWSGMSPHGDALYELSLEGSRWRMSFAHLLAPDTGPYGRGPVQDASGNIYTTVRTSTVAQLSPSGSSWSYSELGPMPVSGCDALGGLLRASDGHLYGTCQTSSASGVWYKLAWNGSSWDPPSTLASTAASLISGVVEGASGDFFGTTRQSVYEISKSGGSLTTLHDWGSNTFIPAEPLLSADGNIYGVTQQDESSACGRVWRLAPDGSGGWTASVLHTFQYADGCWPESALVEDARGNLYGTTVGPGTVFALTREGETWTHSVLHSFGSGPTVFGPLDALRLGPDGNLYGTTHTAGGMGAGSVFRVVLPKPELSAGSPSAVTEGDSGTVAATFPVTLSFRPSAPVTVSWATVDGSAVEGSDYTAASGTVSFAYGETSKAVTVQVLGDTLREDDETFSIRLSGPTNATILQADGTVTITDDDVGQTPSLSIGDATAYEGAGAVSFPVTLSAPSGQAISVSYATADGTAVAGPDYTAKTGTLDFAAGETSGSVTVSLANDGAGEPAETFSVSLTGEINASVSRRQATGTILDGAAPPTGDAGTDFDGDGRADLFWRSDGTGEDAVWLMNGATVGAGAMLPAVAGAWSPETAGDLDGDGKDDVVWMGPSGEVALWFMNGTSIASSALVTTLAGSWHALSDDFDGDGKDDLFLHNTTSGDNAVWLMNGATIASAGLLPSLGPAHGWLPEVGDLDGDGKADVFWHHASTGATAFWFMDGLALTSVAYGPTVPAAWSARRPADLDLDGREDLVWRGPAGEVAAWLMDGSSIAAGAMLPSVPPEWDIEAIGDFDGDHRADVFWRNGTTGDDAIWFLNGLSVVSAAFAPAVPDTGWDVHAND